MSEAHDSREVSIVARVLGGTAWLIVSDDLTFADGVARALRTLGATVHVLDSEGVGIARLAEADAQVALLTTGPASSALRRALDAHAGLRWAAPVQVTPAEAWPDGQATPDVDTLMRLREAALSVDGRLRERAHRSRQQELELAELGTPRLLRALAEVPASFVVQLSTADADAHVALDHGQWIGASYRPRERGATPLDGMPALCRALDLRAATCLVLPAARLSKPGWRQPLETALSHALTTVHGERQFEALQERTRSGSRRLPATRTAHSIGPPRAQASLRARRARNTSMVVAAAVGGFSLMALVTLLLESGQTPAARGAVTPYEPTDALEPAEAALGGLHVEPLAPEPAASRRQIQGTAGEGAGAQAAGGTQGKLEREDTSAADGHGGHADEDETGNDAQQEAGRWRRSRRLAEQANHTDDPARARELYERALGDDPRNPHALVGLARLSQQQGQLEQALALMERATAVRSKRVTYRILHGRMLLAAQQPRQALEAFETALQLRPDSRPAQTGARTARKALATH